MSGSFQSTDSFEDLVRQHQAGLRAYVRALGAQEAWVDDLAQEVFLVAYRRLAEFDATADFGCWLRGIARHLVANERRKQARHSRLFQHSIAEALADEADALAVGTSETSTCLLQALSECVQRLPARSRALLEHRYTGSADAKTLAAVFQISATAVRQSLVRIRAAVRRCLDAKLGESWL